MGGPAKRRATYEDLLAVPARLPRRGDHQRHPRHAAATDIAARSRRVVSRRRALSTVRSRQAARMAPEAGSSWTSPSCNCTVTSSCPISLDGAERMPELPEAAAFELPPDWVCEVLSPSTAATDRAETMPVYAREGVAYTWLVSASTPSPRRSMVANWKASAGCSSEPGATTPGCEPRHSTPSSSSWPASGRSRRARLQSPLAKPASRHARPFRWSRSFGAD